MDRLPPLRLLAAFDEVARRGSMREAANHLNVTQPAITQAIKALEDHLGVALLDRTARPARLTPAGIELARALRAAFSTVSDAIDALRARARGQADHLTVTCTLGMATHWLMPRLPAFYALHPEIAVNVQAPPQDAPTLAPGIDVALRYGAGPWRDGETTTLFEEEIRPVGRAELLERLDSTGCTLTEAPLIHVEGAIPAHWEGWRTYFKRLDLGPPRGPAQIFDNYVQAVQAALDGRGLVLGWRSITGDLERDGALQHWPAAPRIAGACYSLTVNPRSAHAPAVRAFRAWALSSVAAER